MLVVSAAVLWLLIDLTEAQSTLSAESASVDGDTLTIALSASVDAGSAAAASDFTVSADGSTLQIEQASVSGAAITLTLATAVGDAECDSPSLQVSYTGAGSSITASGDNLSIFSALSVTNQTDSPPIVSSVATDATGRYIRISFCEAIEDVSFLWSDFSAFTVSVDAEARSVNDLIRPSNATSRLDLDLGANQAIKEGQTITVAYDQSKGDENYPLQDLDQGGKLVESWSARAVTNVVDSPPELVSITALWDVITLTYSETLDENSVPDTSAFAISDRPYQVEVHSVEVSGETVVLSVSNVIRGELDPKFQLSYTAPGDSPLQQADGATQADDFYDQSVYSSTPTSKPVVQSAAVNGATLTITFDLPLKSVADASAFTIGGVTGIDVSATGFNGSVVTLTLSSSVSPGDSLTVGYERPHSPPRIEARNVRDADSFRDQAVTNDTPSLAPTFLSASINAAGDMLTITMSGDLLETSAGVPAASAFALAGGTAAVSGVSISGATVTLSLSPKADVGETITVSYTQPTGAGEGKLQSLSGGHLVDSWTAQSVTNGADGVPRPTSATVDGSMLAITFDRTLDVMSQPATTAFTLSGTTATVSSVGVAGSVVTLTLSAAVEHDDVITVTYAKPQSGGIKRLGHALFAETFASLSVTNETPEPLIRSVIGDETEIAIMFSKALDSASTPAASAFALGSDGPTVESVTLGATTASLSLAMALSEGGEYTLSYSAPVQSPLRTADGSPVASFAEPVANVTDVAPTVESVVGDGATLTITFDQPLDAMGAVDGSWFSLTGDAARTVAGASTDGSTLALMLASALKEDEAASVAYMKPATGGIADPTGNQVGDFSSAIDNRTDTAPMPVSGTVEGDMIVIFLDQELYEDPRFNPLADDSVVYEHFTLTGTDVDVSAIEISNGGPGGVGKIALTLSDEVEEGDSITIRYFPGGSQVRIRDDDSGMNRAEIDNYQLVNLTRTPPTVESATLDGAALSLVFDRALSEDVNVAASWFSFASGGLNVDSASVSGAMVSLVVSPRATEDAEYELTYTPPVPGGLESATGVAALGFTESVDNVTDYAPSPVELKTDDTGQTIFVVFDQRLDPGINVKSEWFSTEPSVEISTVTYVAVEGEDRKLNFELEAETPLREGIGYTLTYTAPEVDGLQDDDAPNRVKGFQREIDNLVDVAPQLVSAKVNGREVALQFDQELDDDATPPASCEMLQLEDTNVDCSTPEDFTWFTVTRVGTGTVPIDAVEVSDTTVTLRLTEPVGKRDTIGIEYQPKSYDNNSRDLRDISGPANSVDGFSIPDPQRPGLSVENVTPVKAVSAMFGRATPDVVAVQFDGPLRDGPISDVSDFSMTVDGQRVALAGASALGRELALTRAIQVPECVPLAVGYDSANGALLDSDERPVGSFGFDVANLIDAALGLRCVHSDYGGLVLTFDGSGVSGRSESGWRMSVNGAPREAEVQWTGPVARLLPAEAVCQGDSVTLWSPERMEPVLERDIVAAAPCAVSTVASGTDLRITFDQALDPALPNAADFTVSANASVAAVVAIDGPVLLLQLTSPGIGAGQEVNLTYSGSSLTGTGLTVGPFTIPVRDVTEPPRFVSGFGVGELIALSFDQPLLARALPSSRFVLAGFDDAPKISRVEIGGSSLYLHLASSLPDEPDLFGVVYLAKSSGGLAGLTGARVPQSVFVLDNYTETPPGVAAVDADRWTLDVRFDQRIDGGEAVAADFIVYAGRRELEVTEMEWSRQGVVLTISERITSPDAVLLTYAPSGEGRVRDLSGNELAEFEFWADNVTRAAESMPAIVEEARLRSSSGGSTFARELMRGVVGSDGIRVAIAPGTGQTRIAYGDALLAVDAEELGDSLLTVGWSRLDGAAGVLAHFEYVPPWCWDQDDVSRTTAWWLGESDAHGVPSDRGVAMSVTGSLGAGLNVVACVLDLNSGEWRFRRPGDAIHGPALILSRVPGPEFSSGPWSLAR